MRELILSSLEEQSNIPISGVNIIEGRDINIVFTGDSLTHGFPVGGQVYPNMVKDWIETTATTTVFNSFGIPNQTTQQMILADPAKIDHLVDDTKTNILVSWEDVNAILQKGRTALENYNDFVQYYSERKQAGFDYIIHITGFYPRTPLLVASWSSLLAEHKAYLDKCVNEGILNCDSIIDLRGCENIGGGEGQSTNDNYFTDALHLTNEGYQAVANSVINRLKNI